MCSNEARLTSQGARAPGRQGTIPTQWVLTVHLLVVTGRRGNESGGAGRGRRAVDGRRSVPFTFAPDRRSHVRRPARPRAARLQPPAVDQAQCSGLESRGRSPCCGVSGLSVNTGVPGESTSSLGHRMSPAKQ